MFTIRAARDTLADLPGIETARLSIAGLRGGDAPALRRLTDDPAITAAVDFLPTPFTLQDAEDLIRERRAWPGPLSRRLDPRWRAARSRSAGGAAGARTRRRRGNTSARDGHDRDRLLDRRRGPRAGLRLRGGLGDHRAVSANAFRPAPSWRSAGPPTSPPGDFWRSSASATPARRVTVPAAGCSGGTERSVEAPAGPGPDSARRIGRTIEREARLSHHGPRLRRLSSNGGIGRLGLRPGLASRFFFRSDRSELVECPSRPALVPRPAPRSARRRPRAPRPSCDASGCFSRTALRSAFGVMPGAAMLHNVADKSSIETIPTVPRSSHRWKARTVHDCGMTFKCALPRPRDFNGVDDGHETYRHYSILILIIYVDLDCMSLMHDTKRTAAPHIKNPRPETGGFFRAGRGAGDDGSDQKVMPVSTM